MKKLYTMDGRQQCQTENTHFTYQSYLLLLATQANRRYDLGNVMQCLAPSEYTERKPYPRAGEDIPALSAEKSKFQSILNGRHIL